MTFNRATTSDEVGTEFASQIKGKTILVTGTTWGGIGAQTALTSAKYGASLVIITGRKKEIIDTTISKIIEEVPSANILSLVLDLSSLQSVRNAAAELLANPNIKKIDVLVNNAGIMGHPYSKTIDGFENQFATNYLGHFLFTCLIFKKILAAEKPRIVNLTSWGHKFSPVRFDDLGFSDGEVYLPFRAYGQSKTANILFTKELHKRYHQSHGLSAYSVHPGSVHTNLTSHLNLAEIMKNPELDYTGKLPYSVEHLRNRFIKNVSQGASTTLVAAFDPSIEAESGTYFADCVPDESDVRDYALAPQNAEKLWNISEELVGEKF